MRNFILIVSTVLCLHASAQDPLRFTEEIDHFKTIDNNIDYDEVILFTGSSSVRFWPTLEKDYLPLNVINRGFGGSQFSDLIYFADQLIIQYLPQKIFIYEGDNDVSALKSTSQIMEDAAILVSKIRRSLPNSDIYFISPKPSIARWNLKAEYLELNEQLENWTNKDEKLHFIDVWSPMCDSHGEVLQDIFIADDLHMNAKGYEIWKEVIRPFVISE